ncbi:MULTISPECIES: hypothetical protein [unclassified Egicoccus]|uniref:hypothetical protein n=1 Tax=unclassified Egicoccus TaxID=2635606 RepID=UPI00359D0271
MGATDDALREMREASTLKGKFQEIVSPRMRAVSRDDYGDSWPLTIEGGWLRYEPAGRAIFRTPDGDEYALNGMASTAGYAEIEPIWRFNDQLNREIEEAHRKLSPDDDYEPQKLRVNIGPLIRDALALKDAK